MKPIYRNIIAGAALAMSLGSCNDFLTIEPEDKLVMDNYYTSPAMLRAQTLTLYNHKTWSEYAMNFMWDMDMLSGDIYYTYADEGQYYYGTYTDINSFLNNGYKGLYNVVMMCNSVINDMPRSCKGIDQADITKAVAEARCIRGYVYYIIAELWHNAPIIADNSGNIADNNLDVPLNTQKSIYRFALEDFDFAVNELPDSDMDNWRCTKNTARAFRSKLLLTMASHSDYGYDRADLYKRSAADALAVIESRPDVETIPFSTLFDVEANNGPESIFQLQCGVLGYAYGNSRNVNWSRSSVIADQTWGAGKGPTVSLQKIYDQQDGRRKWTYMTQGDYYPMLDRENGGYTYQLRNYDAEGTVVEERINMNAHIKKYVIGKAADCNGQVGLGQDAGNNLYLMRLADLYLIYTEALMGEGESLSGDGKLDKFNAVRARASMPGMSSISYEDLLRERRREFAFESINWFDILRLRYRKGDDYTVAYINNGLGTGYNRSACYLAKYGISQAEENMPENYTIVDNRADYGESDPIYLTKDAFELPIPAAVSAACPAFKGEPVDYFGE